MNYYDVLGLKKDASYDDIKTKYRELAKAYHPDKATNKFAIERFKRINEAYKVLSDPYTRGRYDQKLEMVNQNSSPFGSDFDEAMRNLNKIFTSEEFIRNSLTAPNNHITRSVSNNGNCTSYVTRIVTHPDSDDSDSEGERTIRIINNNFRTPIIEEVVEKKKPLFKPKIKEIVEHKKKNNEDEEKVDKKNNEENREESNKTDKKSRTKKVKEEEKIQSSGKKKKEKVEKEVNAEIVTENPVKKSRKKKTD